MPLRLAITGIFTAFFALRDVLQVAFRPEVVVVHLGEVGERLGEAFGAVLVDLADLLLVVRDLLFEERVQHDRGGPGRLQPRRLSNWSDSGQAATDQRVLQGKPEILGAQVDAHQFTSFLRLVRAVRRWFAVAALPAARFTPANC